MQPEEIDQFVNATNTAYWIDHNARLFDKKVEQEERQLFAAE